ncbi:MAG: DUF4338 domain-containing protein [Hyphomonadaceae bacterium]|nr:DUF4338 domain-containing protein [Hyphomonadaceae bacterium]
METVSAKAGSPRSSFLAALAKTQTAFGRSDVALKRTRGEVTFSFNRDASQQASPALRQFALRRRLAPLRAWLKAEEDFIARHGFFDPVAVSVDCVDPEIVACQPKSDEARIFRYFATYLSLPAETDTARVGKYLVFDRGQAQRQLIGLIGLRSPSYFNAVRDKHLGWPPYFQARDTGRVRDQGAFDLRNAGLKSIYQLAACMPLATYGETLQGGRLLASLSFAPSVISTLESRYGNPILGLITTGGWGGSAAQYERIHIATGAKESDGAKLFRRIKGDNPSRYAPIDLFPDRLCALAIEMLANKHWNTDAYANYKDDPDAKHALLHRACRHVGLHSSVLSTNTISHYFGAVSEECRASLATLASLAKTPANRTVDPQRGIASWRRSVKVAGVSEKSQPRLSSLASRSTRIG